VVENASAIKARLAEAGCTNVRVFGSVARGDDGPDSDIDLLYDVAEGADAFAIGGAWADIVDMLGCQVDLVSARAVPKRNSSILREAVPL